MNWIEGLSKAIQYAEHHLTDDLTVEDVAGRAYTSSSHFQFIFHVVTGLTIGEYIRNRRLSQAAQDLQQPASKIADVAERYRYDTQESFSKAFTRFHGIPPSKAREGRVKTFHPLTVHVTMQGGFAMPQPTIDFHLLNWDEFAPDHGESATAAEKYGRIVAWAGQARGKNPVVFDALTEWILDDSQWGDEQLAENEQILMQGVFARFKEQNARLRAYLGELESSGVVNAPVFGALDRFDAELSGKTHDERLRETVAGVFADFSAMRDRRVRERIAGNPTGPEGVNTVAFEGYINHLKNYDAGVQWALFMPEVVKKQQTGFQVDSFTYRKMPALRFIGRDGNVTDTEARKPLFAALDALDAYRSEFPYDLVLMHHYGLGVDVGPWHGFWGRFFKAGTPVPDGFEHFDLVPENDGKAGPPFLSQFAYAVFSGDSEAIHRREGYDSDAMYDVTRNIILGQGVNIPYPDKYWTAEVFPDGFEKSSTAYLFGVEL